MLASVSPPKLTKPMDAIPDQFRGLLKHDGMPLSKEQIQEIKTAVNKMNAGKPEGAAKYREYTADDFNGEYKLSFKLEFNVYCGLDTSEDKEVAPEIWALVLPKKLGDGVTAEVYPAQDMDDPTKFYVLKVLQMKGQYEEDVQEFRERILGEFARARAVHQGVSCSVQNGKGTILEPFIHGRNLAEYAKELPQQGYDYDYRIVSLMLLSAMDLYTQCHLNRLVHADVNANNFLVHGGGDSPVVKVFDLGEAKVCPTAEMIFPEPPESDIPSAFPAPELPTYSRRSDIFALAGMFAILLDVMHPSLEKGTAAQQKLKLSMNGLKTVDTSHLKFKKNKFYDKELLEYLLELITIMGAKEFKDRPEDLKPCLNVFQNVLKIIDNRRTKERLKPLEPALKALNKIKELKQEVEQGLAAFKSQLSGLATHSITKDFAPKPEKSKSLDTVDLCKKQIEQELIKLGSKKWPKKIAVAVKATL